MNIKAIFVAASALILSATAVSAQNPKAKGAAKDSTCMMKKCDKAKQGPCMFENLNLTDAQKAKIKDLKESQMKARKDRKMEVRNQRDNARKDYLANLKTILTPEQYVQFLENNYISAGKHGGKDMKRGDRKGGKDMKSDFRKGGKDGKRGDRKGAPSAKADKK
ncbi:MAG: Spy/CpxP family protein refolding chaperone [Paramuribaculum sp.]|nr:Spy/CpxP family protein refolding chaperone [Paramuribaculum sp.]